MRNYSSLLVFEDIFNYIPSGFPDLVSLASMIFTPNVPVVSTDCGTTLGYWQTVNYQLEGAIELATGEVISRAMIDTLLAAGTYSIATRSVSTCIAPGGVCQACYHASNQADPVPAVNSRVTIKPEYPVTTDVIAGQVGVSTYDLTPADDTYQWAYVYIQGVLQPVSSYTILNSVLTFNTPLAYANNIVVHYTSLNTSPFLVYLAKTYSGSMLGMNPLPAPLLPLRSLLIESLISQSKLQLVIGYTSEISTIPEQFVTYIDSIADSLEQALYVIAINCIFAPNATV
jgi:hypothetical protein